MMDGQESWTSTVTSVVSGPWTPNNQDSIPKGLEEDAVVVEEFIEAKLETKVSVRRRPQKDDKASKCVWTAEDFFGGREGGYYVCYMIDNIINPLLICVLCTQLVFFSGVCSMR
eukprot:GHVS01069856.1.p1 GENE.GHVS01069856.1~~GHVS01069856.1.p1  ORF type:complete len:114 (+),score=12.14 GHVS01069856.1:437-778(+)